MSSLIVLQKGLISTAAILSFPVLLSLFLMVAFEMNGRGGALGVEGKPMSEMVVGNLGEGAGGGRGAVQPMMMALEKDFEQQQEEAGAAIREPSRLLPVHYPIDYDDDGGRRVRRRSTAAMHLLLRKKRGSSSPGSCGQCGQFCCGTCGCLASLCLRGACCCRCCRKGPADTCFQAMEDAEEWHDKEEQRQRNVIRERSKAKKGGGSNKSCSIL